MYNFAMNKIWNIVIPCSGLGSRFYKAGIKTPKPLFEVDNITLIEHSINSFNISARFIFITRDFENHTDNEKLSDLLLKLRPESEEIRISNVTNGAAESVLAAKHLINNDNPLVIYNCDQILSWNPDEFIIWIAKNDPDGALVLYESQDPKNSYAEIKDSVVCSVKEKEVISNHALVGFHYWKKGTDYVNSANLLLDKFHSNGAPECYVSETYNYLNNLKILPYHIASHHYIPLGTPEDIARYHGKKGEYFKNKPLTIFLDLDGTLIKHKHAISLVHETKSEILPGVREKLDQWDSLGFRIILVTARKESERRLTIKQLEQLAIPYDILIMGVTNGPRVLVNDKLSPESVDRALAVNVVTDDGFKTTSWEDFGL